MSPRGRGMSTHGWLWLAVSVFVFGCSEPRRAQPDQAIPGVTVDAPCVDQRCSEGLICRYGSGGQGERDDRCVLESGRCRDDWDCARSVQRCRRFGTQLGVCQDSGL